MSDSIYLPRVHRVCKNAGMSDLCAIFGGERLCHSDYFFVTELLALIRNCTSSFLVCAGFFVLFFVSVFLVFFVLFLFLFFASHPRQCVPSFSGIKMSWSGLNLSGITPNLVFVWAQPHWACARLTILPGEPMACLPPCSLRPLSPFNCFLKRNRGILRCVESYLTCSTLCLVSIAN